MLVRLFHLIKKIIVATVLIYSFDIFAVSLNLTIPINIITIALVSIFDIPALVCLVLISLIF